MTTASAPIDQHGRAAMRRGDDRVNRKVRREAFQRVDEKTSRRRPCRGGDRANARRARAAALGREISASTLPARSNTMTFKLVLPTSKTATQPGMGALIRDEAPPVAGPSSGLTRVRACIGSSLVQPARGSAAGLFRRGAGTLDPVPAWRRLLRSSLCCVIAYFQRLECPILKHFSICASAGGP